MGWRCPVRNSYETVFLRGPKRLEFGRNVRNSYSVDSGQWSVVVDRGSLIGWYGPGGWVALGRGSCGGSFAPPGLGGCGGGWSPGWRRRLRSSLPSRGAVLVGDCHPGLRPGQTADKVPRHPSAAKAGFDFADFPARINPCPFKTAGLSSS